MQRSREDGGPVISCCPSPPLSAYSFSGTSHLTSAAGDVERKPPLCMQSETVHLAAQDILVTYHSSRRPASVDCMENKRFNVFARIQQYVGCPTTDKLTLSGVSETSSQFPCIVCRSENKMLSINSRSMRVCLSVFNANNGHVLLYRRGTVLGVESVILRPTDIQTPCQHFRASL